MVERYRYTAYGTPTVLNANHQLQSEANATGYRFLFTGREWLSQVGLNDHRYRYYSPSLGRWFSTDPIRFSGGDVNLYRYTVNTPINLVDLDGLDTEAFHWDGGLYVDGYGFQTTTYDGNWVWSCVKGSESSSIDTSPGFQGFTGVGVQLSGGTLGLTWTADANNSSRFESCSGGCKKYVVDLKVTIKKNLGVIVSISSVMGTLSKSVECPCGGQ